MNKTIEPAVLLGGDIFERIIGEANDAIFIIAPQDGAFRYVNDTACRMLGYNRQELLALRVQDIEAELPDNFSWLDHIAELKSRSSFIFHGKHRRKDGTTFPVDVNTKYFSTGGRDHIVAIARDASDRRTFEKMLLEERNKLDSVLAAIGDGLTLQDREYRILYQNAVHQQKQGNHLGEYCFKAYQNRDAICEGCLLEKSFTDGKVHKRQVSADTERGTMYMEVAASPVFDAEGTIVAGIETVRDITDQKKLELQLLHAQKMEAVGRLTSGIAHDFNNLLSVIVGYSELILKSASKDMPFLGPITTIHEAGIKAADLTRQLLAFSRKQVLSVTPVDLNVLLSNMSKILYRLIGEDISLELHLRAADPVIMGDRSQIEQVVMNLAINARDAMPEGGRLFIATESIEFDEDNARIHEEFEPAKYVQLSITDTGIGMDRKTQEKIFDPFFTTKKLGKGTGLGLSTVYGIMKQHGGLIKVYSEPRKGTVFKAYFPQAARGGADELADKAPDGNIRGEETILVVDDEAAITGMIAEALRPLGYTVLAATSGAEALRLLQEKNFRIDMLLTDVIMPEMTGRQLSDLATRLDPHLKVLYMSGYTDEILVSQGVLQAGIHLLAKPVTPHALAKKIRQVFEDATASPG